MLVCHAEKKITPDGDIYLDVCEIIDEEQKNKMKKLLIETFEARKHFLKNSDSVPETDCDEVFHDE